MGIRYTIHPTPQPDTNEEEPLCHARALSYGTKRMEDICKLVCERSTVSSADVKAVLDSMVWVIGFSLKHGNHVELEDLGHFSPSLRSRQLPGGKYSVVVDGVNFRCSGKLKQEMAEAELERVKYPPLLSLEERKACMIDYIRRNGHISVRTYAEQSGCTRYKAGNDLKRFVEEGLVCRVGSHTHVLYVLCPKNE